MRRRAAGFSLIEIVVAAAIGSAMLVGAISITVSTSNAGHADFRRAALAEGASRAADQVVADLQIAGLLGEDANQNGVIDAGEDTNRNGRLDADFDLADGATASTVTFNQVDSAWLWTAPATYDLNAGVLERTENGTTVQVCRNVSLFNVTRSGDMVTVYVELTGGDGTGRIWVGSARRVVHVRN